MVGSKGVTKQLWYVQSIYTRGKPEVSHVPSWTMRWKGSVTALASVFTVVCTSERHAWPCISRRGLGGCKQELVMRKCSERSIECVRRRGSSSVCSWETILQLTEVKGSVANYLAVHCVELASEVLWRWRVVMVGHPGVTVWGEPVVDWCFCCSSLSQLLGWHLLPTPLSR